MLWILERLRWAADEAASGVRAETAVTARAFAYLYGTGASIVLITLALPSDGGRQDGPILIAAAMAYAVVAVLLIGYDRLPRTWFLALPPLGTLLVSAVVGFGGGPAVATYAFMYFWVVLISAYFFSATVAAANMVLVGLAYAVVLAVTPGVTTPETKWLMAAGALGVSGLLMSLLRERVARLFAHHEAHAAQSDVLAAIGRHALDPERAGGLPEEAVRAVREALGADCAAALVQRAERREYSVVAAEGWSEDFVGAGSGPVPPTTLTGAALASERTIIGDERLELTRPSRYEREGIRSTMIVALRGREGAYGVLSVAMRTQRTFTAQEASFLQAVAGVLGSAIERARTADRLHHQAFHDDLTGQPNRHLFLRRLSQALARAREEGTSLAVLFLDLDNFKVINDSLGHAAGDALLMALTPRLREALYLTDTVARFGGDEFVILCEGIKREGDALAVTDRLHRALEAPFKIEGATHRLTASVGVVISDGADVPETLLRNADAALSRAKVEGRNRAALYDSGMHAEAMDRLRLENALRDAQARGELRLAYQPIVDPEQGRLVGFEALLRWRHPELGDVSPAQMIPVAEETGLIVSIGEWVLAEACAAAARWRASGIVAPHVAVNVAARQLAEPTLPAHVAAVLKASGVPPGDLVIEITESALLEDSPAIVERLAELRALGVRLALDDFGTGYSSLAYLRRFPVDTLKVDRSFVATVARTEGDAAIVGAVLGLAVGMGIDVVAEGIEEVAQLERLREMGCRLGQGYLLGRPGSAEDADALVASGGSIPVAVQASASVS